MRSAFRRQRGISLIEAMVALAVMAFGTLAVLGVQTTLRLNADISKQRNEAVRMAQEALEAARGFDSVATYDDLLAVDSTPVTVYDESNASYQIRTLVEDAQEAGIEEPQRKTISVVVTWEDRSGSQQTVRLNSAIHRVPPSLGASLVIPADLSLVRTPGGRNIAIPPDAEMAEDGRTSSFAPPNAGGIRWTFDNVTGFITQVCNGDVCTALNARLLSGYVRFATELGGDAPDDGDAKYPPGVPVMENVIVAQTLPMDFAGAEQSCFERLASSHVAYYCAVPVGTESFWGGQSRVVMSSIAATLTETSASKFRICRYTAKLGHLTVPAQMTNDEHPLNYFAVRSALVNQNFLVIRAGNGTIAFDCPSGDNAVGDPYLSGRTYRHQPAN